MASSTAAIIRLKRKRGEDPLQTLYLGVDAASPGTTRQDSAKRTKVEHASPSIFTLALTVNSDEYTSIDKINVQDLYKSTIESRPQSSDSDSSSKKRSISDVMIDPPKFRMSRKRPRQDVAETIPLDYEVFDAIREPVKIHSDGIPTIRSSGIPDEIQSGNPAKDAALHDMLRSYLTVDQDNRKFVNLKDEYVYDIYYRTAVSPATVPTDANFGVLVYDDSEPDLIDDEEVGDEEDADSNSEGYYQNSYPDEDEWAGEGWGSEEDEDEYGRRRTRKIGFDSDEEIGSESGEDAFSYSETE